MVLAAFVTSLLPSFIIWHLFHFSRGQNRESRPRSFFSPKQHRNACYAGYSNLNCIYLLQKRMVRLISKAHHLANTVPLFSKLKVLDIYSIYSFSVATFMYSYHHNLLPSSFRNLFWSSNQVHHYEIRIASQYRPHFCGTKIKQFSVLYGGPSIWNSLPVTLTSSSSLFVF